MLSSFRPLVQVFLLFLLAVVAAVEVDKEQVAFNATEGKEEGDQVEECGNQLTAFLLCLSSTGGAIFNDAFQEECQGCIAAEYGTNAVDVSMLSCDELVQVVGGALDRCAKRCALDNCTTQVRALLTCSAVTSSDCRRNTSTPSAAPSTTTSDSLVGDGDGGAFAAFLAVIRRIIALLITIFGSSSSSVRSSRSDGGDPGRQLLRAS
jgi:hypothetical protein